MTDNKYKLLRLGVFMDVVGMLTMVIPVVGPFLDVLWAPYAAKKMTDMYEGSSGKVASIVVFVEELVPGLDFIPTFTLMWLYTFVFKRTKNPVPQTIEVESTDS